MKYNKRQKKQKMMPKYIVEAGVKIKNNLIIMIKT